jgi:hypothetical protein
VKCPSPSCSSTASITVGALASHIASCHGDILVARASRLFEDPDKRREIPSTTPSSPLATADTRIDTITRGEYTSRLGANGISKSNAINFKHIYINLFKSPHHIKSHHQKSHFNPHKKIHIKKSIKKST